jgi:hypothetical protein
MNFAPTSMMQPTMAGGVRQGHRFLAICIALTLKRFHHPCGRKRLMILAIGGGMDAARACSGEQALAEYGGMYESCRLEGQIEY